jgi:hypothetical protein
MSNKNFLLRLPHEINALISTFLEKEGDILRKHCGKVMIKEIRNGQTYGNGVLHSFNDIPALIWNNGTQVWYKNGKRHRDNDLPAVMGNGYEWYKNGERHRDNDMPAIIWPNGTQYWYKNGERHRDNGPAIIYSDGKKEYYKNGIKDHCPLSDFFMFNCFYKMLT